MRRFIVIAALPLFLAACQGTSSLPAPGGAQGPLSTTARGALPIVIDPERMAAGDGTFSTPKLAQGKGPPSVSWIFASNGEGGNVDVYEESTLALISQCACTGVGLAVDPKSGDLAVGAESGTVTVWHVGKRIKQFATLKLSQGPYSIGLAYDKKGDLYAGNAGDNVIDFFDSSEIKAGGGNPTRTLVTSHLNEVYYLAAAGKSLLADGYDMNGQPILVSVNTSSGADTILQQIQSGQVIEGITFDLQQNLILNTAGNTNMLSVFKKPWNGSPTTTFDYGTGAENSYYTGISLNKSQDTLWAGNFFLTDISHGFADVQANSYPLGTIGNASSPIESEYYDSIAVDPQARN